MAVSNDCTTRIVTFEDLQRRVAGRQLVFPPQVEKVAAAALARPELLAFESADKIAARAGVSKATVARFARLLGNRNLKEARRVFREELRRRHDINAGRPNC
ncbi:RpiR family transcriptional regulator [Mesorhizobium cantuariense]|uniref:RpiR family transcriptional regulator n=1 Tax=Mesorhizobium cantuariense TaxID=1300275 RepID=A0ABV7MUH0_9HYPH